MPFFSSLSYNGQQVCHTQGHFQGIFDSFLLKKIYNVTTLREHIIRSHHRTTDACIQGTLRHVWKYLLDFDWRVSLCLHTYFMPHRHPASWMLTLLRKQDIRVSKVCGPPFCFSWLTPLQITHFPALRNTKLINRWHRNASDGQGQVKTPFPTKAPWSPGS